MFGRKPQQKSVTEMVGQMIEADKALRQRDAAVRHALGREIIAGIDAIAYMPTWGPEERKVVASQRHAIKNLVAMAAGLPPVEPQRRPIKDQPQA